MRAFIAKRLWLFMIGVFPLTVEAGESSPRWTYDEDDTGQEDWGTLPGYQGCGTGSAQSPIVISYTKPDKAPPFRLNYHMVDGTLTTSKESFAFTVEKGGTLLQGNHHYTLRRIEFHTPSEHMVRDVFFPLEIHLLHQDAEGNYFIVAVFANTSAQNPALQNIINAQGKTTVDITSLLPADQQYYAYSGSLTYPPCTETVQWRVLKTPITLSQAQLTSITRVVSRNARLPQPLYMRVVTETQP